MASRYYGMDRGQTTDDIDEGSSTTSSDVEIVINLAKSLTRAEVLQIMDMLKERIIEEPWAPA
jgi:hypothetical protein